MTHTKGPWEVFYESGRRHAIVLDAYGVEVGGEGNYSHDDACLIASAPDLLEALRDCVERFTAAFPASEEYEPIKKARAAISKASHKPQER